MFCHAQYRAFFCKAQGEGEEERERSIKKYKRHPEGRLLLFINDVVSSRALNKSVYNIKLSHFIIHTAEIHKIYLGIFVISN